MRFVLVFLTLSVLLFGFASSKLTLMNPSKQFLGKFDSIYLPMSQSRFLYGITGEYNIVVAPLLPVAQIGASMEICFVSRQSVPAANFSCVDYFCGPNEPLYLKNIKKHWDLFTYCNFCSIGAHLNFSMTSLETYKCKWINLTDVCSWGIQTNESLCIPFQPFARITHPSPLYYYPQEDRFYAHRDFVHTFLMPYVDIFIPWGFTVITWILMILQVFLVLFPEIIQFIVSYFHSTQKGCGKTCEYFGYRVQGIFWMILSQTLIVVCFTAYSVGLFYEKRYKTYLITGLILALFLSMFAYLGQISLWMHIIEQTDMIHKVPVSKKNALALVFIYIVFAVISVTGAILRFTIQQHPVIEVIYGVWVIIFLIVQSLVFSLFLIVGLYLYIKIKTLLKGEIHFLQLKFTRQMMFTDILVGSFIIYLLYFAIVQFVGLDFFGWPVLLLSDVFLYSWLTSWSLYSFILQFDLKLVKSIVCCRICRKDLGRKLSREEKYLQLN